MAYRSDHEAALARVETLEHDNARLLRDNAALRAELATEAPLVPGVVQRGALWSIATLGMFVLGVIVGIALTLRAVEPSWHSHSHARPVPTLAH